MATAFNFVLVLHMALCVALVLLVLMQQGKGADMGAAFGAGGSNTLFGAGGATSMMVRLTTGVAVAFMITSIALIRLYPTLASTPSVGDPLAGSVMSGQPAAKTAEKPAENVPAAAGAPAAQQSSAPAQVPAVPAAPVEQPAQNK